jgi:thiol-disulfide isomerase/thioredoxin/protocatechuate 3,4-dioxygenase beta subunit
MDARSGVALAWPVLLVSMAAAHAGPKAKAPAVPIQANLVRSVVEAVSGRVLTPDGTPVKGAAVFWTDRIGIETRVLASVTSDDAGRFQFGNVTQLRKKGEYSQLVALVDGWALSYRTVPPDQNALDLRLEPATRLRVAFLDPEGKPAVDLAISARLLFAREAGFCTLPVELEERFDVHTDGQGIATIDALPQAYRLLPAVRDARFAQLDSQEWISLTASPETQAKAIRLTPGASLRGRVTFGPSGRPVSGIRINAQGVSEESGGWRETVTGADGSYELRQLGPGVYDVALDLGELATSWTARAHERLVVPPGEHLGGIDFQLIRGALLTGRVLAADNGAPIVGIGVGAYIPGHTRLGGGSQGARTGPDGRFVIRVPGGRRDLFLSSAPPGFLLPALKKYDLTVRDGETITRDFRLPRARPATAVRPVRGRVLGPDGKPVADAEVIVVSSDGMHPGTTTRRTDASGAFTLEADLVARSVTVRARHAGMATVEETLATGGDEVTLRLQSNALGTLSGRVADAAGNPIAGAEVSVHERTAVSGREGDTALTDEQGRYLFPTVWPNALYTIYVTAEGYGEKSCEPIDGLRPGETRALEPLTLRKADRSVAGRVVDASGDPVAGATIWIEGRETRNQSLTTDREGHFRRDGVVDEMIQLQCYSLDKSQWTRKKVPAGSMDVVLVLPRGAEKDTFRNEDELAKRFAALQGRKAPPLNVAAWLNTPSHAGTPLRGRVVLIDFWGMGCGPCIAVLPEVQRLAEQFAKKGVVVIGLHPADAKPEELQAFAKQRRLTFPLAIDVPNGPNSFGKTYEAYGVRGIPTAAVLDADGNVAYLGTLSEAVGVAGSLVSPSR